MDYPGPELEAIARQMRAVRAQESPSPNRDGERMFCTVCGNPVEATDKLCGQCGEMVRLIPLIPSGEKGRKGFWGSLFDWRIDPEELPRQIIEYRTLRWTESYRKIAGALWLLTLLVTSTIGQWLTKLTVEEVMTGDTLYAALAIFCFRGHRWAFLVSMILWTFEKVYNVTTADYGAPVFRLFWAILWWALYLGVFWKAFDVERKRRVVWRLLDAEKAPQTASC